MQTNRNIRISIKDSIQTQLVAFGFTNVYTEAQMQLTWSGTFTPVLPYVFFLDEYTMPQLTTLPMVILDLLDIEGNAFELGNRKGRDFDTNIHVFGNTRGQREDIASYLQDNIPHGITIYDYTSGSAGASTLGTILMTDDSPTVVEEKIPNDNIQERSLYNWSRVTWRSKVLA
jgi:hypothetical protein